MKPNPLVIIKQIIQDRHPNAKAVFWAGSVANLQETSASDLDLVIVYEHIERAYREAFRADDWPIDTFIHDPDTLRFFFEESKNISGISGLMHMIVYGQEIMPPSDFSKAIVVMAKHYLEAGPSPWSKEQIDTKRFLLTDQLEDIEFSKSKAEQIASASYFYGSLAEFYFHAQGKWSASGKVIARYLEKDNREIAETFNNAFAAVFEQGKTEPLKQLVQQILIPYGGLLWNGYHSKAPIDAKIFKES